MRFRGRRYVRKDKFGEVLPLCLTPLKSSSTWKHGANLDEAGALVRSLGLGVKRLVALIMYKMGCDQLAPSNNELI
ncbi:hypothetical protein RRG08_023509 [Elysia crispata]|uniref:Uncharacterized protein n=1 Tax=Elysia crispata TaxID=231223 RepID=A0AAE1D6Q0_9GAST|nr:hypothetical protein RRG08_023509 [Elysia crispata]